MEEILKLYGIKSKEELEELIEKKDPKVADLIEFLNYYEEQEKGKKIIIYLKNEVY